MVDDSHMTIVPGDRDRVPILFRNSATIGGIAFPVNAVALFEALGLGAFRLAPPVTKAAHNFGSGPSHDCALR